MGRIYQRAVNNYLTRLRSRTLIRTMFDETESDPRLAAATTRQFSRPQPLSGDPD